MPDARHDSTANAYHSTVACLSGRCAAFLHVHIEIVGVHMWGKCCYEMSSTQNSSKITCIIHVGIISLLSALLVLFSFLLRYSSSLHNPKSFSVPQNLLYSSYLLFLLAACGPHIPRRNVGGIPVTHGEHRHSLQ